MGVMVVGMHRSGTSAVSEVLETIGLDVGTGTTWERDSGNQRGLYEWRETADFNDDWLAYFGGSWSAPPRVPESTWHDLDLRRLALSRGQLQYFTGNLRNWFVKDPRISLLIPLWDRLLLKRSPLVIVVRSPYAVAESLRLRDGFHSMRSMALWVEHYRAIMEASDNRPSIVVDYEQMVADPRTTIEALADFLPGAGMTIREDVYRATDAVDAKLNRQAEATGNAFETRLVDDFADLYQGLRDAHLQPAPEQLRPYVAPQWVDEVLDDAAELYRTNRRALDFERQARQLQDELYAIQAGGSYRMSRALSTIADVVRRAP